MTPLDRFPLIAELRAGIAPPRDRPGVYCTETRILRMYSSWAFDPARDPELDVLSRKIEVGKFLNAFYDVEHRPFKDAECVADNYADLFCAVLLARYDSFRDVRALNTALKMIDGILIAPRLRVDQALSLLARELLDEPLPDACH